jgi:ABC-type transport system involved in cytochrome bd biosynthesis fused ATPase/permease subunit
VKTDLRGRLLHKIAELGPAHMSAERTGELTVLATRGLDALDGYFARYLPQVVLAGLIPLAVLGAILPADLIAGATIAVTLPLIPVFMALVGRATQIHSGRQFRQLGRLAHHFLELVTGLPTLKAFGRAKAQAGLVRSLCRPAPGDVRAYDSRSCRAGAGIVGHAGGPGHWLASGCGWSAARSTCGPHCWC